MRGTSRSPWSERRFRLRPSSAHTFYAFAGTAISLLTATVAHTLYGNAHRGARNRARLPTQSAAPSTERPLHASLPQMRRPSTPKGTACRGSRPNCIAHSRSTCNTTSAKHRRERCSCADRSTPINNAPPASSRELAGDTEWSRRGRLGAGKDRLRLQGNAKRFSPDQCSSAGVNPPREPAADRRPYCISSESRCASPGETLRIGLARSRKRPNRLAM